MHHFLYYQQTSTSVRVHLVSMTQLVRIRSTVTSASVPQAILVFYVVVSCPKSVYFYCISQLYIFFQIRAFVNLYWKVQDKCKTYIMPLTKAFKQHHPNAVNQTLTLDPFLTIYRNLTALLKISNSLQQSIFVHNSST